MNTKSVNAALGKVSHPVRSLVKKTKVNSSPHADYSRTVTDFFAGPSQKPYMHLVEYCYNGNTTAKYAERQLSGGRKFVMFDFRDPLLKTGEVFKGIRNKFGEFLSVKANFEMPLGDPNRTYKGCQEALASRNSVLATVKPSESTCSQGIYKMI